MSGIFDTYCMFPTLCFWSCLQAMFQWMQMDLVDHEWLQCSALGNVSGLYHLLLQDPSLLSKKVIFWSPVSVKIHNKQPCLQFLNPLAFPPSLLVNMQNILSFSPHNIMKMSLQRSSRTALITKLS